MWKYWTAYGAEFMGACQLWKRFLSCVSVRVSVYYKARLVSGEFELHAPGVNPWHRFGVYPNPKQGFPDKFPFPITVKRVLYPFLKVLKRAPAGLLESSKGLV